MGKVREVTSRGTILVLLIEALQNTSPGGLTSRSRWHGIWCRQHHTARNASSSQVLVALARELGR